MSMHVHLQFGIPLPLNPSNVYSTSPKAWLVGAVSVPEGIMAPLGEAYLDKQGMYILNRLKECDTRVMLKKSSTPKQYKFIIDGNILSGSHPLFSELLQAVPELKPLNVTDYCQFFEQSTELWSDPELLEFVELLEAYLDNVLLDTLKTHYTFINFALK